VLLLAVACGIGVAPGLGLAQSETPAEQAAREIQEARDRANAAAEAFFAAESTLDLLEEELIGLEREEEVLQEEVTALRREVESVALSRFVASGTSGIPLLTEVSAPQDQIQAEVFVDVLTNTGADVIDQFDAAEKALVGLQDQVVERRADVEAQREEHARLRDAANDEVVRLREIEEERLEDEAVQKALAAQLAKERARIVEEARLEAEAAARAQPNPGLVVPPTTVPPSTTVPADGDDAAASGPAGDDTDGTTTDDAPVDTTPETTSPPVSTLPENSGASGGESGGRTGVGGAGSSPTPVIVGSGDGGMYIDAIVCPILGTAFADTWGAPRSGGRRHVGVDMIAPRGVPIYAVVSGYVTFKANRLGGNAASLVGDNGNRYYYGHMDSYNGVSRRVTQGEIIAYNGDTGNAKYSTPHLHFEIRPGGGVNVNPYPSVLAAGC
jgi:peptidoglycan LD-endopeptidase LytH